MSSTSPAPKPRAPHHPLNTRILESQATLQRLVASFGIVLPHPTPVIPAKAGIQCVDHAFLRVCGVDSRFRGNDSGLERPFLANDTTALQHAMLQFSPAGAKVRIDKGERGTLPTQATKDDAARKNTEPFCSSDSF